MAVAVDLIRVAIPESAPVGATVIGYYYDSTSGLNGRILAYEYDSAGTILSTFQLDLPTLGTFGDFAWTEATLRGQTVYDGNPGLVIGATGARPGFWFWRPRIGTLAERIIYNLLPVEIYPSYVSGSFYTVRAGSPNDELLRLDSSLQTAEVLGGSSSTVINYGGLALVSPSTLCVPTVGTTYAVFPLSGGDAADVDLGITGAGYPHTGVSSLQPSSTRFARSSSTVDGAITFPWPNAAPWLPSTGTTVVAQYADGHVLASEAVGSGRHAVLGIDGALIADDPIVDMVIPFQGGIPPYHVGIGNLP